MREQVGLPITVGVARTKFLAKVASGVAKPDGLLVVPPDARARLPAPAARSSGCGASGRSPPAKLHEPRHRRPSARSRGSREARAGRDARARRRAGTSTRSRTTAIRGRCSVGRRRGSIGSQRALGRAAEHRRAEIDAVLVGLVDRVTRRMRAADRVGRTVVLRLRFDDFTRATRSHTLPRATAQTPPILATARGLLDDAPADDRAARAHARRHRRSATSTTTAPSSWRCRFDRRSGGALDAALDDVRDRFGSAAVTRAVLLGRDPG